MSELPFPPPRDVRVVGTSIPWKVLIGFALIPFYFINTYVLIPKYLVKGRYLIYSLYIVFAFLIFLVISKLVENFFVENNEILLHRPLPEFVIPMTMLFAVGTSLEMVLQWEKQKRKQETVEKEKVSAELAFLKSQLNPHFLFNTLNNIYSLAEVGSKKTGQSVLLLSNLMRYILYETSDGKILLSDEVKHLEEYIALQRMRIVENAKNIIDFRKNVTNENVLIEPLLFIPFVENSFKHGISYAQGFFINIELSVDHFFLYFKVTNSKKGQGEEIKTVQRANGIGIINTKRRLELLYPGRHTLEIIDYLDCYGIHLTIRLDPEKDFV